MSNRRQFLQQLGYAGLALSTVGIQRRAAALSQQTPLTSLQAQGFGTLYPTPTLNTGETLLALPKGFRYTVFGKVGGRMSDGNLTPAKHDGMACFQVGDQLRLIRNHEVSNGRRPKPNVAIGEHPYDSTAAGGTTTLVIDPETRTLVRDFVSLSGTLINCAGGRTPWNSWISCEETALGSAIRNDNAGKETGGYPLPHGYCFEVAASADGPSPPTPLKAMGRFHHEAVAIDPHTGLCYLTEDADAAGFYRFTPNKAGQLAEGGTLHMLKIADRAGFDTRKGLKTGQQFATTWVSIADPDPRSADLDSAAVYQQGHTQGAATFARLEGAYPDKDGHIYFAATSGGNNGGGQIWRYRAMDTNYGQLTLVFESPSRDILDMPDNLCIKPNSDLVFICEDSDYLGENGTPENYLRILAPNGKLASFAKNIASGYETSEFAGASFSPDGQTLFVNLQALGASFAIWGNWSAFDMR